MTYRTPREDEGETDSPNCETCNGLEPHKVSIVQTWQWAEREPVAIYHDKSEHGILCLFLNWLPGLFAKRATEQNHPYCYNEHVNT